MIGKWRIEYFPPFSQLNLLDEKVDEFDQTHCNHLAVCATSVLICEL